MARFALIDPHARRAVSVVCLAPVVVACGRTPLNVPSHVDSDAESDSVAETESATDAETGSDSAFDTRIDAVADRAPDVPLCNGSQGLAPQVTDDAWLAAMAVGDFNRDGVADLAVTNYEDDTLSILLPVCESRALVCLPAPGLLRSLTMRACSLFAVGLVLCSCGRSGLDIFADVDANVIADSVVDSSVEPTTEIESEPTTETESAIEAETEPATEAAIDSTDTRACHWSGFAPAKSYAIGSNSQTISIAVGDFDKDGHLDFAIASEGLNTVRVYLNAGDGTFADRTANYSFAGARQLAVGDFNGDQYPDIVTTDLGAPSVGVFFNRKDGTFASPPATYTSPTTPGAVGVGDFNRDGHLDFATLDVGTARVLALWANDGTGGFGAPATYALDVNASDFVVADFNGDAHPDVAVENDIALTVSVLLNDGTGAMQPQVTYDAGARPSAIAAGDFDGDGLVDLATANYSFHSFSVMRNLGKGTFGAPTTYATPTPDGGSGFAPVSLTTADFDGDGHVDIAIADLESGGPFLQLWLNPAGDGHFTSPQTYAVPTGVEYLAVGDFNGDGYPDLAVSNYANAVSVLLSDCQ